MLLRVQGWRWKPPPLYLVITHIFIERKINKSVALHIVELTKELHFCEYFYIYFGGYCLLIYLFHTLIYLKIMVTILIIIIYMMSCILLGARKSYISISIHYDCCNLCSNSFATIIIRLNPGGNFYFIPIIEIIKASIIFNFI